MTTIHIQEANLKDQIDLYHWLYYADSSRLINSLDGITDSNVPSYKAFTTDFQDFFFTGSNPEKGRSYIIKWIENSRYTDIGAIHYIAYHLLKGFAELDMWMKGEEFCGKGFGPIAIQLLAKKLRDNGFKYLIIRPLIENARAIGAYKKAGFT